MAAESDGLDLSDVRQEIGNIMYNRQHDDGSFAPLFIRFAWHCCGTYDKATKTGGSNGGTMRFDAEKTDPENAGFEEAVAILDKIHAKYSYLSRADLNILAGYIAIEMAGGPCVRFSTGRVDFTMEEAVQKNGPSGCPFGDGKFNPKGSRLPAADLGPDPNADPRSPMCEKEAPTIRAVRGTFDRMGFSDEETVCLIILGHQYGRCHPEVSGFEDPWYAFDPTHWNIYPHGLGYMSACTMASTMYREGRSSAGKRQYNFSFQRGMNFMMLISDMALVWDPEYYSVIQYYDTNRHQFRKDAAAVWKKLTELGCDGILTPETTMKRFEHK